CGAVETVTLFEDPFVVGLPREHLLAKEARVKPERLWHEDLLLLKDGHCLRDHALAVCRLADRRLTEGFEATSLPTLVQMSTTVSAPPCCLDSLLMPACFRAQTSLPGRCSAMIRHERLVSSGAAAPGAAANSACSQRNSQNAPKKPRHGDSAQSTRSAAVSLLTPPRLRACSVQHDFSVIAADLAGFIIAFFDQCERNYSLELSTSEAHARV